MRYFKKMSGEKCYLSPLNLEDAEMFTAWLNDIDVTRNLALAPQNISLSGERAALERLCQEHTYSIVDAKTDTLIGSVGLTHMDAVNRCCNIGIHIGNKDYWGRGYGREAMRLLMAYAFDFLNINNIMLTLCPQ